MDEKRIGYANESFYYGFSGEQSTIIRTEVTLSQEVIPDILHEALLLTLKRYPNFRRTLAVKDNNIFYRYNEKEPVMGPEDGRQYCLGTSEVNGYLFRLVYDENRVSLCGHHGLTDGKGMFEFTKTLLYYYLTGLGENIAVQGRVLTNEEAGDETELEYSFEKYADPQAVPMGIYKNNGAFRVPETLYQEEEAYCRRFRVDCSAKELLKLAKRYGVTPVPVLPILISQVFHRLYEVGDKEIIGYIPVNLRPYYHSRALNNFSLAVALPYHAAIRDRDWEFQATIQRGILDLQTQKENFDYRLAQMCISGEQIERLPLPAAGKQAALIKKIKENSREKYTYLISYVGIMDFPEDMKAFVRDIELFIPSFIIPFTMCVNALEDKLTITCTQNFDSDKVAKGMYDLLREQGITAEYEDLGYIKPDKLLLGLLD